MEQPHFKLTLELSSKGEFIFTFDGCKQCAIAAISVMMEKHKGFGEIMHKASFMKAENALYEIATHRNN